MAERQLSGGSRDRKPRGNRKPSGFRKSARPHPDSRSLHRRRTAHPRLKIRPAIPVWVEVVHVCTSNQARCHGWGASGKACADLHPICSTGRSGALGQGLASINISPTVSEVTRPTSLPCIDDPTAGADFSCRRRNASSRQWRWPSVGTSPVIASATGVRPQLLERANDVGAAEHADRPAVGVDHGKFALAGAQQCLDRFVDMRVGRSRANCVIMAVPTGTPRDIARNAKLRLRRGRQVDEDRDEDQDRIVEQAKKAECKGDDLADRCGDLGRADKAEAARQQGAQHAPAIHRKRRDHVEHGQEQVDGGQTIDQRDSSCSPVPKGLAPSLAPETPPARMRSPR